MLEYSPEAKRVSSVFFQYKNDIDIYTEDGLNNRVFYLALFKKLIDPKIKIENITTLGRRRDVIKACKNEPKSPRRKLFIIDGDLTIVHGKNEMQDNLFVLDSYCIENYLFDEQSVVEYISCNSGKAIEEVKKELNYESWLKCYSSHFIDLFLHFAIADDINLEFKLFNAEKYFPGSMKTFSHKLIEDDVADLKKRIILKVGEEKFNSLYMLFSCNWPDSTKHFLRLISGKDYLIPLLNIKTTSMSTSGSLPNKTFTKNFLLKHCTLKRLVGLKLKIESLFN